jgi:hypothetical protein
VLEREQPAGAAKAGLHLVDAEECPVPAAQGLSALQIPRRRQVDAFALHRLDEEDRDVLPSKLELQRVEIAERHLREPGQERCEAVGEPAFPFAESELSVRRSPARPRRRARRARRGRV